MLLDAPLVSSIVDNKCDITEGEKQHQTVATRGPGEALAGDTDASPIELSTWHPLAQNSIGKVFTVTDPVLARTTELHLVSATHLAGYWDLQEGED